MRLWCRCIPLAHADAIMLAHHGIPLIRRVRILLPITAPPFLPLFLLHCAATWQAALCSANALHRLQFLDWWLNSTDGSCVRETKANIVRPEPGWRTLADCPFIRSNVSKLNHDGPGLQGMAYEINVLTMALFVNDSALARSIANNYTATRLNTQVNGAGEPFLDAPRPDGFGYAAGDFSGLLDLARVAQLAGGSIDLYTYVNSSTGASLRGVGDFFAPFCTAKCNVTSLGHDAMGKCLGWPFHQVPTSYACTAHRVHALHPRSLACNLGMFRLTCSDWWGVTCRSTLSR